MPAKKTTRKTAASITSPARTVIYCHGICNKPAESTLRSEWDRALFGFDQGERTRMAYWVDRERYPQAEIRSLGMHGQSTGVPEPGLDSAQILKASIANSDDPKACEKNHPQHSGFHHQSSPDRPVCESTPSFPSLNPCYR